MLAVTVSVTVTGCSHLCASQSKHVYHNCSLYSRYINQLSQQTHRSQRVAFAVVRTLQQKFSYAASKAELLSEVDWQLWKVVHVSWKYNMRSWPRTPCCLSSSSHSMEARRLKRFLRLKPFCNIFWKQLTLRCNCVQWVYYFLGNGFNLSWLELNIPIVTGNSAVV